MAKVKRLPISPEVLFRIMQTGTSWKAKEGIPIDAKLAGFTLDPFTQVLHLFVEHSSFEDVEIRTDVAPILKTVFEKI